VEPKPVPKWKKPDTAQKEETKTDDPKPAPKAVTKEQPNNNKEIETKSEVVDEGNHAKSQIETEDISKPSEQEKKSENEENKEEEEEEDTTGMRAMRKETDNKFTDLDAEMTAGRSKLSALRAKMKALREKHKAASAADAAAEAARQG